MIELVNAYWIKIFATAVIFTALIILFLRDSGAKPNISGAELVKKELDRLDDSYIIFDNVIVQSDRGISNIPYVLVSPYGVFVVSLCDLPGKISGHKDDREWKIKGRGFDDTIFNPLWENRKYINALEKKLGSRPFVPAVVFTHAKLANDFGPIGIRIDQLQKYFSRHEKMLINLDNQKSIVRILKETA